MTRHCDVPGCDRPRRRLERLCGRCFGRLPGDIRVGIIEAHHQRRLSDWRDLRRRAAAFLRLDATRTPTRAIAPEIVFERTARLLGERP